MKKDGGPIFRIMWGQGVDEDVDLFEYPYDLFSNSAPIYTGGGGGGGKDDVSTTASTTSKLTNNYVHRCMQADVELR